jgi:hypothetical protein
MILASWFSLQSRRYATATAGRHVPGSSERMSQPPATIQVPTSGSRSTRVGDALETGYITWLVSAVRALVAHRTPAVACYRALLRRPFKSSGQDRQH